MLRMVMQKVELRKCEYICNFCVILVSYHKYG